MKMIQCKKCGEIYSKQLSNCPKCFEKNKKYVSKGRKTIGIILIVIGCISLFSVCANWGNTSDSSADTSNTDSTVSFEKVNYENFEKIKNNMNYEEVIEIFGKEGKLITSSDLGIGDEYKTELYCWYDETEISNCTITFQNRKVIAKTQIGLK